MIGWDEIYFTKLLEICSILDWRKMPGWTLKLQLRRISFYTFEMLLSKYMPTNLRCSLLGRGFIYSQYFLFPQYFQAIMLNSFVLQALSKCFNYHLHYWPLILKIYRFFTQRIKFFLLPNQLLRFFFLISASGGFMVCFFSLLLMTKLQRAQSWIDISSFKCTL